MKTVKMTVGELKHLVTEGRWIPPTVSHLRKTLDGYEKKLGTDVFRADLWMYDIEYIWDTAEPKSSRELVRYWHEVFGDPEDEEQQRDLAALGPKFFGAVFKAMMADKMAYSRRS